MNAEYWSCDVRGDSVAVLNVPPALARARVFDVDVMLNVGVPSQGRSPWHELKVELDGKQRWARRIDSHAPADSLDYHCRVVVEPNEELRIRATAGVRESKVLRLQIEAREDV